MKDKKYDIFSDLKTPILSQYPNLSGVVKDISFSKLSSPIEIDTMVRYIIYLYDINSDLNRDMPDVDERRSDALRKFKISKLLAGSEEFYDIEREMASRFMFINCDTMYETWLSGKIRLNRINKEFRRQDDRLTWTDANSSITALDSLIQLEDKIEKMRMKIFGDNKEIERYISEKEILNRNYAEQHAE